MITILRRCVPRKIWVQGHKMTLQHNCVRRIHSLFEVRFKKIFHRNDHHIKTMCCAQHFGRYLERQGHRMTLQKNPVGPITSLFEVEF